MPTHGLNDKENINTTKCFSINKSDIKNNYPPFNLHPEDQPKFNLNPISNSRDHRFNLSPKNTPEILRDHTTPHAILITPIIEDQTMKRPNNISIPANK